MEFYDVIKTRRSIRSYKSEPVSEAVLDRILDAARIAPSGSNRQPWRFIVVRDPAVKTDVVKHCGNQAFIGEAPLIIVACGPDIGYNRGGWMEDKSVVMDVTIAFTQMILAARAEGLGTCWIGLFENEPLKQLLGLPDEFNIVAVTPLGYPDKGVFEETTRRKDLADIVSWDRF
jgi:nitroreductase